MVSACADSPPITTSPNVTVVEADRLPPPERMDAAEVERPYLIGAFDKLAIDVFNVPELSREVQADASGRISLPLAGVIEASGKTPTELAQIVKDRLAGQYVKNPQVTVNLVETVSQVVTIDGQVVQPGLYPVVGRMTLMRAIAAARGTTEFARTNHVVVFRRVGDQNLAALYDLRAVRQGVYQDPEVFASDVIVVGESRARRVFRDLVQSGGLLMAPVVALIQ